jgi:hypothetical protein
MVKLSDCKAPSRFTYLDTKYLTDGENSAKISESSSVSNQNLEERPEIQSKTRKLARHYPGGRSGSLQKNSKKAGRSDAARPANAVN